MKSKTSAVEIQMKETVILCEDIIDDSFLTTKDARKIVDLLSKGLMKIEELRISRDNALTKCQELRKQRDERISDKELIKLMVKSFKEGGKHPDAEDYPIKLWVAGEMEKRKSPNAEKASLEVKE